MQLTHSMQGYMCFYAVVGFSWFTPVRANRLTEFYKFDEPAKCIHVYTVYWYIEIYLRVFKFITYIV